MSEFRNRIVEHIPHLRRYARALVRDPDKSDDLVQDCLARAIARADSWRAGTNLRAWLFTIMHNLYVDGVRRYASRPKLVAIDGQMSSLSTPPDQGAVVELRQMEVALQNLPDEQRVVLLLVGLEGLTYEEAAEVTGVPVGTVRSRISRAREELRQSLSEPRRSSTGT